MVQVPTFGCHEPGCYRDSRMMALRPTRTRECSGEFGEFQPAWFCNGLQPTHRITPPTGEVCRQSFEPAPGAGGTGVEFQPAWWFCNGLQPTHRITPESNICRPNFEPAPGAGGTGVEFQPACYRNTHYLKPPPTFGCPTLECFVPAQAAPMAGSLFACTRPVHVCTAPGVCGTNRHYLC